jgi:hypothetical protein
MPGAFLFRKKAYPKDEGAQAEVAVLNMAVQTNGGSADARNFVKRNVKRSDSLDSSFRGASETSELWCAPENSSCRKNTSTSPRLDERRAKGRRGRLFGTTIFRVI